MDHCEGHGQVTDSHLRSSMSLHTYVYGQVASLSLHTRRCCHVSLSPHCRCVPSKPAVLPEEILRWWSDVMGRRATSPRLGSGRVLSLEVDRCEERPSPFRLRWSKSEAVRLLTSCYGTASFRPVPALVDMLRLPHPRRIPGGTTVQQGAAISNADALVRSSRAEPGA
jgi:hypothetical protein